MNHCLYVYILYKFTICVFLETYTCIHTYMHLFFHTFRFACAHVHIILPVLASYLHLSMYASIHGLDRRMDEWMSESMDGCIVMCVFVYISFVQNWLRLNTQSNGKINILIIHTRMAVGDEPVIFTRTPAHAPASVLI